jgi:hypothetical protein
MSYSLPGGIGTCSQYDASKWPRIVPLASYLGNVLIPAISVAGFQGSFRSKAHSFTKIVDSRAAFLELARISPVKNF